MMSAKQPDAMRASHIVEMRGIRKEFGAFVALHDINLDIVEGEILTLLGPSGCGKTTLMRIIAGFEQPTVGSMSLRNVDVSRLPPEKRPVNMVFQRYALFPHLDVFDNVAFGLRLKKLPETEVRTKVTAMLDLVQLGNLANRWIGELSGGQAQRVALARALVNRPAVLLLDEPLAALDLKIRHYMLGELKRIHIETGTTFVYVTHDQDEAMILSNRIALLNQGRIEQIGTPDDLYARPNTLFAAKFLGESNILEARVERIEGNEAQLSCSEGSVHCLGEGLTIGQTVSISVRPEAILIAKPGNPHSFNACDGVITDVEYIGSRIIYLIASAGGAKLKVQSTRPVGGPPFAIDERVTLSWESGAVRVLVA